MSVTTVSLADIARGGLFTDGDWVETKDQDTDGTVRLTQLADVGVGEFRDRSDRWMREDQAQRLNCTFLLSGDVLIARMPDPIGRACLVPTDLGRAVTAVDVAVLRVRADGVLPAYVMWMINSPTFHSRVVELQSGTTRKRISRKNLSTLAIPVPPLAEQRRIVDLLEDHLSHLDSAAAELARQRRRIESLRASVIDANVFRNYGTPWTLSSVLGASIGGVWGSEAGIDQVDVQVVRVTELKRHGELETSTSARRSITIKQLANRRLEPGDLVLEKSGGGPTRAVGRVGLVRGIHEPAVCANFMQLMRPDTSRVVPRFLHLYLNAFHRRGGTVPMQKATTNIRNLKMADYLATAINLPPLEGQHGAVAAVEPVMEACARLEAAVENASRRVASLRGAILGAACAGRLTSHASDAETIADRFGARLGPSQSGGPRLASRDGNAHH